MESILNRSVTHRPAMPRMGGAPLRRALLVADDLEQRHVMARALRSEGYVVVEVPSGSDVLARLASDARADRESPYDVIVGEVRASDGLRILADLRGRQLDLPVVLVTNRSNRAHEAVDKIGATILQRPLSLQEFLGAIRAPVAARPPRWRADGKGA